jgi:hypothetical protein
MAAGGTLIAGNSALLAGPLGNVYIGFDGVILGKTTADTALKPDEDVKDIKYSQDGSKASDHVSTGKLFNLTAEFGEISTALLKKLDYSFSSNALVGGNDSGVLGRFIYTSLRDNKAKVLKIWATDADGNILENAHDTLCFYEVLPVIDSNLINWGAETQRNVPVSFKIYYHQFGVDQVVGGPSGAFGYYGSATDCKIPAVVWPDAGAPVITIAKVVSATSMEVSFDENIALQGGSYAGGLIAKVDGVFKSPSGVTVSGVKATATFAGGSFALGDVITVSISAIVFQDTESSPNVFGGVSDKAVTNSI